MRENAKESRFSFTDLNIRRQVFAATKINSGHENENKCANLLFSEDLTFVRNSDYGTNVLFFVQTRASNLNSLNSVFLPNSNLNSKNTILKT